MEANQNSISIIIVTYNAGGTLQQCLDSIYKQIHTAVEIIIIDGKSTDNTVAIIQQNSHKIAYWKSEPDEGVYHAMNKALDAITGKWVYFLGADDELLLAFSDMAKELTDPNTIYYANVFADGAKRLGKLKDKQLAKVGIYHQAMIYPSSVFKKHRYNTKYRISADFALTMTLYSDKDYKFEYKDYVIANFNHTGISGVNIDEPFQKDKPGLIYKNFGFKIWLSYRWHKLKNRNNPRA
jgi:glycosyltransferase involved in cell wall biosynthesis